MDRNEDVNKKEEIERDQLLFELISDTYNSEKSRFNSIDDKSSKLIVFVGVLIGLLSSFGSLLLKDIPKTNEFYFWYLIIFISSIIILISSIICGVYAYKIREFKVVPVPDTMIKWGKQDKDKIDILRIISKERSNAVKENEETMGCKIKHLKRGYNLLIIGISVTLIFICFLLLTYNPVPI